MKKIMMFIAAGTIAFCLVPIATTQAMPRQLHGEGRFASALPVCNQKELRNIDTGRNNPELKDNALAACDMQKIRGITIAQSGKSTTATSTGKTNPHVKRSGHGRSTMGDNVTEKDNANDGDEDGEAEDPGDDSAIKYNKGLKNSSGYNKDL